MQVYEFTFIVNLCSYFFTTSEKSPRSKWTIYKHESDKNKKLLSVGYFGILSVICPSSICLSSVYLSVVCVSVCLPVCLSSVARLQPTPAYVED